MAELKISVMIVEDEPRTLQGLRADLATSNAFVIVAEAHESADAIRLARQALPAVILMDLRLKGHSSIEAIRQIRREVPGARILILSVAPMPEVAAAISAGAHGYIDKYGTSQALVDAIHAVRTGTILPPDLAEQVLERVHQEHAMDQLTQQQLRILAYVAHGYYNDHIADALGIKLRTVNRHLENMRNKLGLHRRGNLGALGRAWGLTLPPSTED